MYCASNPAEHIALNRLRLARTQLVLQPGDLSQWVTITSGMPSVHEALHTKYKRAGMVTTTLHVCRA